MYTVKVSIWRGLVEYKLEPVDRDKNLGTLNPGSGPRFIREPVIEKGNEEVKLTSDVHNRPSY